MAADQLDDLLDLMLSICGYGHVKEKYYNATRPQIDARMTALTMANRPVPGAPKPTATE